MKKLVYLLFLLPALMFGQDKITGTIFDSSTEPPVPLGGANLVWLGTDTGAVADLDGNFSIAYKNEYTQLIVSYVGYKTDTLTVPGLGIIKHYMTPDNSLDAVTVRVEKEASARSFIQPQNVILVSSDELLKAACCNLSESFETNPSIDVNFSDAISGTRQIRMLGLTSPYILITTENVPAIRGAAQTYGLSFIPGTWVESIQITKGAGSVMNGFESITGQINAELQKPTTDVPLFLNLYGNLRGRLEGNLHWNQAVSDKWSTGLYVHADGRYRKNDRNDDGFLDVPLAEQINVMNRWQFTDTENGIVSFINLRFLNDSKQTGQKDFDPGRDRGLTNLWGSEIDTQRFDVSGKLGLVNTELPWRSLGVQGAFSYHKQESYFGLRNYDITHQSFYGNLVYNSIIGDSRHKIKTGVSFTHDAYDELVERTNFDRIENSVGGFFEYSFDNLEALTFTAGIRVDNHNRFGFFVTPRFHGRYELWEKGVLRFSAGRGIRSANIFTENQQLFATNREIQINNEGGSIYGLDPEIAWNYGLSFLQSFELLGRKADIAFDFYRTDFENQVVVDWEDPLAIRFYNLNGSSFANSFQFEFNWEVLPDLDLRSAYKYYDVQIDFNSGRAERPLTPRNRVFANLGYVIKKAEFDPSWKFDLTYNWLDSSRFPNTESSPVEFQRTDRSPSIGTLNGQITKVFSKSFEVYLGGENLTDQRQTDPVISADDPFGDYFDSTFVYGPIFGRMVYAGLRLKIE